MPDAWEGADPAAGVPGLAREVLAIAQAGLTYSQNPYDQERYVRLKQLAAELAVVGAGLPSPPAVGTDPRADAVRDLVHGEHGYLTPKLDVRAAVLDGHGRLLLVRESQDGRWSLPGGWADVGESLAEGTEREVLEESGYRVVVDRLLGIYERERWGHPPMTHFTLKAVLACRLVGGAAATSVETTEVGWFGPRELPPLSTSRNSPELLRRVFELLADPTIPPDLS